MVQAQRLDVARYRRGTLLNCLTQVMTWTETAPVAWFNWKLIPVKVEDLLTPSMSSSEALGSGSLPSYDEGDTRRSSTRAQHTEHDDFGTVVSEVTTVVVTTRKKYRVEDA